MSPNGSDPAVYDGVLRLVQERAGLVVPAHRRPEATRLIDLMAREAGVANAERLAPLLARGGAPLDDLVDALTIGETYFFREPDRLALLTEHALPDLRARRGPGHLLRVWSAACASGEEAYTLAMMLEEQGLSDRAHILGTDIAESALTRARRGRYRRWSLRGQGAARAAPWLQEQGDGLVLDPCLRKRVAFRRMNLVQEGWPSVRSGLWCMDLILCRNVLIYFDKDTVAEVGRRLFESLAPGGWLLLGASDPPLDSAAPFRAVLTEAGVIYQRPGAGDPEPAREDDSQAISATTIEFVPVPVPVPEHTPTPAPAPTATAPTAAQPPRPANPEDPTACAEHLHALANTRGAEAALAFAQQALTRHPTAAQLHLLRGLLEVELGRDADALASLRRTLFLDRTMAFAHFTLGGLLNSRGEAAGAKRAYVQANQLASALPADQPVRHAGGGCAGELAAAAAAALQKLEAQEGERA